MKLTIAILFAFLAFSAAQISDKQKTATRLVFAYCLVRERASIAGAEDLNYGNFESKNIDGKTKCLAKCALEKLGFLVNGEVKYDKMSELLGPIVGQDKFNSIQDKCSTIEKGADDCETAYLVYKCLYTNNGPLPGRTERKEDSKLVAGLKNIQNKLSSLL